jgi:hypothetical protein
MQVDWAKYTAFLVPLYTTLHSRQSTNAMHSYCIMPQDNEALLYSVLDSIFL